MNCAEGEQLYRVYQAGLCGWKLRCATSPEAAVRKVRSKAFPATKAVLVRPSSYWRAEREAGRYPVFKKQRRK